MTMRTNYEKTVDDKGNIYWWRVLGILLAAAVVLTILLVAVKYLSAGESWASLPAEKYNAKNVEREYKWFYGMHQQIRAGRKTLRDLEERKASFPALYGADSARWPSVAQDEYKQVGAQALQVQTALNAACGEYSARWNNVFHSMAAPSDIPQSCETIK